MHSFFEKQIYCIQKLQSFFPFPFFWKMTNFLDTAMMILLFLAFLFTFVRIHYARYISAFILFTSFASNALKNIFQLPRPLTVDPSLNISRLILKSYSFPSGAAMAYMALVYMTFYSTKNLWARFLAVVFWIFTSFSRIALGAHYPSDILGGWLFTSLFFVFFVLYQRYRDWVIAFILKTLFYTGCLALLFFVQPLLSLGMTLGICFGMYLGQDEKDDPSTWLTTKKLLFFTYLLLTSLFWHVLFHILPWKTIRDPFEGLFLGFWMSFLAILLLKDRKFRKKHQKLSQEMNTKK